MKRTLEHLEDPQVKALVGVVVTLFGVGVLAGMLMQPRTGVALPMYAQRSGRTCGNCHVSPTLESEEGWDNPELAGRKCNLSCVSCHVNPTGGGLRNASGRYYGQSTLSVLHTQDRSYSDLGHELLANDTLWKFQQRYGRAVEGGEAHDGRTVPSDLAEHEAGIGEGQTGRWTATGKPIASEGPMSFWDGRYNDLNADPLLQIGGDLRGAYWTGSDSMFPMQTDLHAAVQPVEHITVMGTVAGRGRTTGLEETLTDPRGPVFARNAFIMVHELPYMAWAKGGLFLPSFGTYIDDHTSYTRSLFEMDVSRSDDVVQGVEVGMAPNYPYGQFSLFKNGASAADGEQGWGMALNGGFRELAWSVTGHAMLKKRGGLGRGDLYGAGVGWGLNPWAMSRKLPFTFMGELDYGERIVGGERTRFGAAYTEGWWTVQNGLSVRSKWDVGLKDLDQAGTTEHRLSLGLELSPMPGFTLSAFGRQLMAAGGIPPQRDVFVQTHIWF